jgi:hypothetical protein
VAPLSRGLAALLALGGALAAQELAIAPDPLPETDVRFFLQRLPTRGVETVSARDGSSSTSRTQPGGRRIGIAVLGHDPVGTAGGRFSGGVWAGFQQVRTVENDIRREHWALMGDLDLGWIQRVPSIPWLDLEFAAFGGLGMAGVDIHGMTTPGGAPLSPSGTGRAQEYGARAALVAQVGTWQLGLDARWMRYHHLIDLNSRAQGPVAQGSFTDRLEISGPSYALWAGFRF